MYGDSNVKEIQIVESSNCYEYILTAIMAKNKTIQAFLTKENILKTDWKIKDNTKIKDSFWTTSLNNIIIRDRNKVTVNKVDNIVEI